MSREFRVVGKSVPYIDAEEKVTGAAKYSADIQLPGMLYGKILGCPHPHARIKSIDVSEARKIKGVAEILTYRNVPKTGFSRMYFRPYVTLDDTPKFIGDKVAVAAAETEELAEEALSKIKVEYEILPAVFDAIDASKPEAPKIYESGNIADAPYWEGKPAVFEWGDVEKAFSEADVVVHGAFRTPSQFHAALEPRAYTAAWNGKELTVWMSTQHMFSEREYLSKALGLPTEKITVVARYIGGAFGGKIEDELATITSYLSMKTNRPVKLVYSRTEDCLLGTRRPSQTTRARLAAGKDGGFVAIDFEAYYNVGARGSHLCGSIGFGRLAEEYRFPNGRFKAYDTNTNLSTGGPMRGIVWPAWNFIVEQLIDAVAEKLEMNPVEIRVKNAYRKGDKTIPAGVIHVDTIAIEKCVERATSAIGFWDKWKGWGKPVRANGAKRIGIGLAYAKGWHDWMAYDTSAIVKIYPDGVCELLIGHTDLGTESSTTLHQIAAEELGTSLAKVRLIMGNTSQAPRDWGAGGSRTLYSVGRAVIRAARIARQKLIDASATKINCSKEDVDIDLESGEVHVKGERIAISEVMKETIIAGYQNTKEEFGEELMYQGHYTLSCERGGAQIHMAEVEADIETGEIQVLKYVAVQDVGKAINPAIVKNQFYGGVLQGLGYSLREEILWDKNGKCLNPNFMDYKIFTFADSPDIETIIVEASEDDGPYGAKGIGEMQMNPVGGAIANAVYNAVGVRMYEIPITPERLLKALGKI
jgi:xanthine dehydrogenase molybdenum-binding subunit